jgi:hypothetical protein
MAKYQLYFLKDNRLLGNESVDAGDDMEAVRIALNRGEGQTIEVWNGNSRIDVVAPTFATANPASRTRAATK